MPDTYLQRDRCWQDLRRRQEGQPHRREGSRRRGVCIFIPCTALVWPNLKFLLALAVFPTCSCCAPLHAEHLN